MDDLKLLKPLTLPCGLTLPNRLVKSAMAEGMADAKHLPGDAFRRPYEEWARGDWGLILTGNLQVDARHLGAPNDTAIGASSGAEALESWKKVASVCQRNGTPAITQINHPGRQSPVGAGTRGLLEKQIAPSAIPLDFGTGLLQQIIRWLVFGTPKEMSLADVDTVVHQFATAAKLAADSGLAGVELHAAHGYLLAQFLSAKSNKRVDGYGGTAAKRAKIVVDIINAIRAVVPTGFAIGIKLNSVDHQLEPELIDSVDQLRLIVNAGVDFIEISGGSYEDPLMFSVTEKHTPAKSERTSAREAFFLEFAAAIRDKFPAVPLIVTGGFRTRLGMDEAIASDACDLVGIARPACIEPGLPKKIIFNQAVADKEASLYAPKIDSGFFVKAIGVKPLGAGIESSWYQKRIQAMSKSPFHNQK